MVRKDVQQIGPHPKNLKNNTKYEYLVLNLHLSLLLYFFFLDVDFFHSRIQKAAADVSKRLYNGSTVDLEVIIYFLIVKKPNLQFCIKLKVSNILSIIFDNFLKIKKNLFGPLQIYVNK